MYKVAGFLILGLAGGYSAALVSGAQGVPGLGDASALKYSESGAVIDVLDRLAQIEDRLEEQRQQQLLLEERFLMLERPADHASPAQELSVDDKIELATRAVMSRMDRGSSREARRQRMEAAGLQAEQIDRILEKENELRRADLQETWEKRRQKYLDGELVNPRQSVQQRLRAQLTTDEYERYLESLGRLGTVRLQQVYAGSAAATAGLQPGDEIIRYQGERVYDVQDLNLASVQGAAGEPVVIDILRDGSTVQVAVPRGPLGVQTRFARSPKRP